MIIVSVVAFVLSTLIAGFTWQSKDKIPCVMWAWCSGVWFVNMVLRLAGVV